MKKTILVLQMLILVIIFSCNNTNKPENKENENENQVQTQENEVTDNQKNNNEIPKAENNTNVDKGNDYNKLIIGSWYNSGTASGEDIAFMEDGTFSYYSAGKEDNGTWKIEGDKLRFFDTDFKIIEITKEKMIIEDKYGKTTYEKTE